MKKTLISGLALSALSLAAGGAWAQTNFHLVAQEVDLTMPDGRVVTMWGFAADPGGACYSAGTTTRRNSFANSVAPCGNLTATVPGPALNPPAGDNQVRLFVTNFLPEPVSITIPGQERAWSHNNNGPTWTDGSVGGRTSTAQRVRSFGREAATNGGRRAFVWNNNRSTHFKSGSYLYHSGTHAALQVQMGLYGQIAQDNGAGEAYPGVAYDNQVTLFYSEVDADLHDAVSSGNYGAGQTVTSTIDYNAQYYLVNGVASTSTPAAIPIGAPGDKTLVRMHNAGYETHVPQLNNLRTSVVAEDGGAYPHARDQYAVQLHAMKSKDMLIEAGATGTYPLYDRTLSVRNTDGSHGLMSFLEVGAVAGAPTATDDTFAAAEFAVSAGDVSSNDSPGIGTYSVVTPPLHGGLTLNPTGTFSYSHNDNEEIQDSFIYQLDNGIGVVQASVTLNIAPVNDAPVANPDLTVTDEGIAVVIAVLNNDSDVDPQPALNTLSVSGVGSAVGLADPAQGTVTTDGSIVTYTPTGTGSYIDTFEYQLTDGTAVVTGTVTVDVQQIVAKPNAAPDANNDFPTVVKNASLVQIDILGNDTDDGLAVNPADFSDPPGGTNLPEGEVQILGSRAKNAAGNNLPKVNGFPIKKTKKGGQVYYDPTTGTARYTPPTNFRGTDIFKYRLKDSDGLKSSNAKVKITVVNP